MKVVVLSESSADEAAVRVLVDAILGFPTTDAPALNLRARGWPAVRDVLPAVVKHLHYRTDVEGLVVVADSDHSVVHTPEHEKEPACRVCELRRTLSAIQTRPVPGRTPLKTAVGVAVPAVEGWYVHGAMPHVNEATWSRTLRDPRPPFTKIGLKEAVYGTSRPSIQLETERAVQAAMRLVERIESLEADFPGGFGALAADLRRW